MLLSYRGSVNSWECDENDHLNVRFYVEKHWQTLCGGISQLGLVPAVSAESALGNTTIQHIRFLQESRLAAPLSGYVGVVGISGDSVDILTELRHSFTQAPLSTCVHRVSGDAVQLEQLSVELHDLADYARPRGVADVDLGHSALTVSQMKEYGLRAIGMGVVQPNECDPSGILCLHNYMGRISDAMPHLWGLLGSGTEQLESNEGGAVLEYRLRYHAPLRVGERFSVFSGISAVGAKVQRFAHLLYSDEGSRLCVSAEAAGVRMDLVARKSIALSSARQADMREFLIRPF